DGHQQSWDAVHLHPLHPAFAGLAVHAEEGDPALRGGPVHVLQPGDSPIHVGHGAISLHDALDLSFGGSLSGKPWRSETLLNFATMAAGRSIPALAASRSR